MPGRSRGRRRRGAEPVRRERPLGRRPRRNRRLRGHDSALRSPAEPHRLPDRGQGGIFEDAARQGHPGHDPADLFTVLKLNHVINYQTGIYSYHQMESCFFDRLSMDLVKLSLTSNEWCGNTYKEYTRHTGRAALHVRTYWDGQAEATYDLPVGPDVVFYDAIPLLIRSLPQTPGTARALRLVPTQIESRGPKPEIAPATLVAAREETKSVPAGSFRALRWELKPGAGRPDIYWTS